VEQIQQIAQEKHCTAAQLAIAWLLRQDEHIVPIPGTKRISFLLDNLGALNIELTDRDLGRIDAVMPKGAAAGDLYSAELMQMVNL
jgi:aryl-alcohol dehydrogenase-like predicted oxidoreductase